MAPRAIISYDDTLNDHDALELGRVLADAGAELTLAYVRHRNRSRRSSEELEEHEAQALLERGSRWLGDLEVARRVIVHASTGQGLKWLSERDHADIVVFGSDYRTAAGHIAPQRSAQTMLEGGRAAVALAPANYRAVPHHEIGTIGILPSGHDPGAIESAHSLAERLGATVVDRQHGVDLLVVGSRPEAAEGQAMISSRAANVIEDSRAPVLVVPKGVTIDFAAPLYVS